MLSPMVRFALVVGGTVFYLAVAIAAFGGPAAFFAHTPLLALTLVFIAVSTAAWFAGGNLSSGVREDRGNRWVLIWFMLFGVAVMVVPPWLDRRDIWTFGGDGIRWIGVVLFGLGGALRLWPVYVLGHRFSGLVAIQPGHRLVTGGIYAVIRHPSYLGLLINALGWALAFRSGLGVLITAAEVVPVIARIRAEERLLASEFGAAYEAFRSRTWRLVPGIY